MGISRKKQKRKKKLLKQLQRGSIGSFFVFGMVAFLIVAGMVAVGGIPTRLPSQMGDQILPITPTPGGQHSDETQQMETFGFITLTPTPTPTPTQPPPVSNPSNLISGGGPSGLPWLSGVNLRGSEGFPAWRGRPVDVILDYNDRPGGWGSFEHPFPLDTFSGNPAKLIISIPAYPKDQGSLAECANGAYNTHWQNFGRNLVAAGRSDTIVRLNWEFNGLFDPAPGGNWYWQPRNDQANFVKCWQQVSRAIRTTDPQVIMDWTFNAHASPNISGGNPYSAYPGDEYVDIIGIDSYDMYPSSRNDAEWNAQCNEANGLCYMLNFARQHGKKAGIGEWGVVTCGGGGTGGGDNPFYIQKMYDTFKANVDIIYYEAYFNNSEANNVCSSLIPPQVNAPNSAAKYKQLFGK
jgi:glycosyl hydrolase family 26